MARADEITVVIHGTFANPAHCDPDKADETDAWWRRTDSTDEEASTADMLAAALKAKAETVWRPNNGDGDMSYRKLVEWSGKNSHKARVRAGKELDESLRVLATTRGCTAEHPLQVNYVAHSHGGNIVLDSLKHLRESDIVKPRQVVMLGTPLTWRYVHLRFLVLFYIPFMVWASWAVQTADGASPLDALAGVAFFFWMWFGIIELLRRLTRGLFGGRPSYGPRPAALRKMLGPGRLVLFSNKEDEADLMMHLGAAPLDAYRALFRGRPSLRNVAPGGGRRRSAAAHAVWCLFVVPLRLIEVGFIRPIAASVVVPVLETLLERFGLGFPVRQVLIRDYEMVTWADSDPYEGLIVRREVDPDVLRQQPFQLQVAPVRPVETPEGATGRQSERERIENLRSAIRETAASMAEQVKLSHSGYYKDKGIIKDVAKLIAAEEGAELDGVIEGLGVVDPRTDASAEEIATASSTRSGAG